MFSPLTGSTLATANVSSESPNPAGALGVFAMAQNPTRDALEHSRDIIISAFFKSDPQRKGLQAAVLGDRLRLFLQGKTIDVSPKEVEFVRNVIAAAYAPEWTPWSVQNALANMGWKAQQDYGVDTDAVQAVVAMPSENPVAVGESLVEGVEDKHILKAIFIVGAGGSGKGKIGTAMFGGTGLKTINPDIHLERLFKKEKLALSQVGNRYDMFNKARDLRNLELAQYSQRRLGLLIDGTGWDYARVAKPVQTLRDLGYDCYMILVRVSRETSHKRNDQRGEAGGRHVPKSYVDDAWFGVEKNRDEYKKLFGAKNYFEVDNDRAVSAVTWELHVVPKLRKIANQILAKPVRSAIGRKWLKNERKNPTLNKPSNKPKLKKAKPPTFAEVPFDKKSTTLFKPTGDFGFKPVHTKTVVGGVKPEQLGVNPASVTKKGNGWIEYKKESLDESQIDEFSLKDLLSKLSPSRLREGLKALKDKLANEGKETGKVLSVLKKYMAGQEVDPADARDAKRQMADLLRMVGLGALTVGSFPIPGSTILVLGIVKLARKLGIELVPSSFRESVDTVSNAEQPLEGVRYEVRCGTRLDVLEDEELALAWYYTLSEADEPQIVRRQYLKTTAGYVPGAVVEAWDEGCKTWCLREGKPKPGKSAYRLKTNKPPTAHGLRRALYADRDGNSVSVVHSDYSPAMQTGRALGGYSEVLFVLATNLDRFGKPNFIAADAERRYTGDGHEAKAVRYLKKQYGIEHDPAQLKKYSG